MFISQGTFNLLHLNPGDPDKTTAELGSDAFGRFDECYWAAQGHDRFAATLGGVSLRSGWLAAIPHLRLATSLHRNEEHSTAAWGDCQVVENRQGTECLFRQPLLATNRHVSGDLGGLGAGLSATGTDHIVSRCDHPVPGFIYVA